MLAARNAWGPSPRPRLLVGSPKGISPTGTSVATGRALVVLIIIVRCSSEITIRELWKKPRFTTCNTLRAHDMLRATG